MPIAFARPSVGTPGSRGTAGAERRNVGRGLGNVIVISTAAALGGLMFGFDVAIITGAGPFVEQAFGLGPLGLGLAFSSLLFGCVLGVAAAGALIDRVGRRPILLAVALLFALTTVATGLAPDFATFVAARFLGGLAVGAVSLTSPTYLAEVAPAHLRGRLSALYQMAIVTGILISYLINYAMRDLGPDAWRYMFFTGVLPSLLFAALIRSSPETPRFLLLRFRPDRARAVLTRISGDAEAAAREADSIGAELAAERARATMELREAARPLAISLALAVLIHLAGINTIIDYAPSIFRAAGFDIDSALLSTFVIGSVNFAFTIVSFFTIDRFGRKPLYIVGSLGMAASLLALVAAIEANLFHGPVVLALTIIYIVFFCSCVGPVFWTLLPELFPNRIRGRALAFPVLTQWIANAVVVLIFPTFFNEVGRAATFALLATACLAQALFVWRAIPETKGRSLESLSAMWSGG